MNEKEIKSYEEVIIDIDNILKRFNKYEEGLSDAKRKILLNSILEHLTLESMLMEYRINYSLERELLSEWQNTLKNNQIIIEEIKKDLKMLSYSKIIKPFSFGGRKR